MELPLSRCLELHLSGCEIRDGALLDLHHGILLDEQIELLDRLIDLCPNLVGVTYEDLSSASEQFARRYHLSYPVLRDVSGSFVRSYGTTGVPETFVINRKGQIQALQRFPVTTQWLNETLPRIWAEKS